ncbi:MAG TPA: hypothetical protein VFS20_09080 [Longimicrobium sp.]|nr:hypothetical protein [Longimicrobium sp.]
MRLLRLLASLVALVSFAACDSPTFRLEGPLAIEVGSGRVQLHNRTDATVYFNVVEREYTALADWIPCSNPAACDGIAPGERQSIAYDDIMGYEAGAKEAVVYWWSLVPAPGGGYSPDNIRSEVIRL